MKNSPIVGIFVAIIVVLLIVIFSLGYHLNKYNTLYSGERVKRIRIEEDLISLNKKLQLLTTQLENKQQLIASKESYIEELEIEIEKLTKLKEKLEENLKEELIKGTIKRR